jgi:hypothetical protein
MWEWQQWQPKNKFIHLISFCACSDTMYYEHTDIIQRFKFVLLI